MNLKQIVSIFIKLALTTKSVKRDKFKPVHHLQRACHFKILIKGVRNTHDTCLVVGKNSNCIHRT